MPRSVSWTNAAVQAAIVAAGLLNVPSCAPRTEITATADPPTIVPWKSIGAARLGMTRARIEATYGRPRRVEKLDDYFPAGTRYYGKTATRVTYPLRGGELEVTYVGGRAKVLSTTSPRYRTADGIHVGLHVRTHRCGGSYGCWRNLSFSECVDAFIGERVTITARPVEPARRRVTEESLPREGAILAGISFGDPDVMLTCF